MANISIIELFSLYNQYGGAIQQIWNEATSNDDLITKVEKTLPMVAKYAPQIAAQFFPNVAPQVNQIALAAVALNKKAVTLVQQACNTVLSAEDLPTKLVVDGVWGPKTDAAFNKLQSKLGLTVDGWLGLISKAAIEKAAPSVAPA